MADQISSGLTDNSDGSQVHVVLLPRQVFDTKHLYTHPFLQSLGRPFCPAIRIYSSDYYLIGLLNFETWKVRSAVCRYIDEGNNSHCIITQKGTVIRFYKTSLLCYGPRIWILFKIWSSWARYIFELFELICVQNSKRMQILGQLFH